MVLGFKTTYKGKPTGFPAKIMAGTKIHSLREDANERWRAGIRIDMATGVRTKRYDCFHRIPCTGTQHIKIKHWDDGLFCGFRVIVDGNCLREDKVLQLIKNDGFDSVIDFYGWFRTDFKGKIIHWTDFRY